MMSSRTVSLVLIAAVIACPLWCGNGFCRADQCCSPEKSEASSGCLVDGTQDCCRLKDGSDDYEDNQQCPCESSQNSCQGICGGAVLGKTIEVDESSRVLLVRLIDACAAVTTRLVECSHHRYEQHCCGSDSNYGRSVRTLHMSFLC
jgi:hypothetical protein